MNKREIEPSKTPIGIGGPNVLSVGKMERKTGAALPFDPRRVIPRETWDLMREIAAEETYGEAGLGARDGLTGELVAIDPGRTLALFSLLRIDGYEAKLSEDLKRKNLTHLNSEISYSFHEAYSNYAATAVDAAESKPLLGALFPKEVFTKDALGKIIHDDTYYSGSASQRPEVVFALAVLYPSMTLSKIAEEIHPGEKNPLEFLWTRLKEKYDEHLSELTLFPIEFAELAAFLRLLFPEQWKREIQELNDSEWGRLLAEINENELVDQVNYLFDLTVLAAIDVSYSPDGNIFVKLDEEEKKEGSRVPALLDF